MSKFIDAEKLITEIKRRMNENYELAEKAPVFSHRAVEDFGILAFIEALRQERQEQPEVPDAKSKCGLEYWLKFFGMPTENIENCATQISQGYGACRYLEGVQHGAEAVNELGKEVARQEQPEVDLAEEITRFFSKNPIPNEHITDWPLLRNTAIHFYELGLIARKED